MSDHPVSRGPSVPPPIVAVGCLAVQVVLARSAGTRPVPGRRLAAGVLAAAAFAAAGTAARTLAEHGTTIDARDPSSASALVTDGIYARTRNPIYLGLTLLLKAVAVWTGRVRCLLPVAGFVVYIDRVQIPAEEAALSARFGADFDAYRAATRRWL